MQEIYTENFRQKYLTSGIFLDFWWVCYLFYRLGMVGISVRYTRFFVGMWEGIAGVYTLTIYP